MNNSTMRPLPKNKFWRGICLMARRYMRHNVTIQSAALAFFLLFAIFPMLIFVSALLGLLHLNCLLYTSSNTVTLWPIKDR